MISVNDFLLPHEYSALLESLRRDLRIQQELAKRPGSSVDWHQCNARMTKRLLNLLNPKRRFANASSIQSAESFLARTSAA